MVTGGPLEGIAATLVALREMRVVLAVNVANRSVMLEMDQDCIQIVRPAATTPDLRAWLIHEPVG
jgi:hypothetical protein